jgi:hypothetical protein
MLSDPERFGRAWTKRLVGSAAVPAIAAQSAQAIDPHMRDAQTIVDAIKARVPVLSQSLAVKRNIWGEAIERGDSLGPDILSPIYATQMSTDPVNRDVARLRVPLSPPKRFMKIGGQRVDLTPEQYGELQQLTGQPAKQYLGGVIGTPEWQQMSNDERAVFVKEAMKEFRAMGRASLEERYPELAGADANEEAVSSAGMNLLATLKGAPRKGEAKPRSHKGIGPPEYITPPLPAGYSRAH